jgi:hypothetical protein
MIPCPAGESSTALRKRNAADGPLCETDRMRWLLALLPVCFSLAACEQAPATLDDAVYRWAEEGRTEQVLEALAGDDGVDRRDVCLRTPLMFAAQFGRADTVRELLGAGANANLHEKGYYTALMLAAGNGHTEVVRLLADAGASVDEVEITHGWTALIWAAKRGHHDTVELLLTLGADRSRRDDRGWSARDWALQQGFAETAALL